MLVEQGLELFSLLALGERTIEGVACVGLEKVRRELNEPLRLDRNAVAHVLLGRHQKLVVDEIVGGLVEDRRARVDVDALALNKGLVGAHVRRVLLGCIRKESSGDRHANAVVCAPARDNVELVAVHDCEQLLADVLGPLHRAALDKVVKAPRCRVVVALPCLIHGEQREMVAFDLVELCLFQIGLLLLVAGPVEDGLHGEHRDDGQQLLGASQVDRDNQRLCHLRLERELGHLAAEAREQAFVVERAKRMQTRERRDQTLHGRRIHEIEAEQIVDPHRLELEHRVAQIAALNLWHGGREQLVAVCRLRVQTVALARARATRTSCALARCSLGDWGHNQRIHAVLGIVHVLLGEPRVDDIVDAVDGERGLGDVGCKNHLASAGRRRLKDARLHLRGQR
eukprot:comp21710_c0_seq1/m.48328 comp21710_c0_seq1/g.48328  ORF comp21710_c0_seq1/g.48328 comp21710_c0_seq1/m.48328 type:complete len:398 (-) comp21710_c0_seq1:968-2161(-)